MAHNNKNSNSNAQNTQQGSQAASQNNSNAAQNAGWVTVNTSSSVEAQRMNIMKGNDSDFFTKTRGGK